MPQSLTTLNVHLVFSTKNRERLLSNDDAPDLHSYMGGTLKGMGCVPIEINTEPDHVHLLFMLGRTVSLSDVVRNIKTSATEWLRSRSPRYARFHWQAGYGAFSVSQSSVDDVRDYIRNQREHHRVKTYQEEFLAFLRKHDITYDERYVWD